MTTDPLRALLSIRPGRTEVRPVPNGRGGWDIAIVIDPGYRDKADADDIAGWYGAQLVSQGVRCVAPERTTTA